MQTMGMNTASTPGQQSKASILMGSVRRMSVAVGELGRLVMELKGQTEPTVGKSPEASDTFLMVYESAPKLLDENTIMIRQLTEELRSMLL
jgi:hypothetical protein